MTQIHEQLTALIFIITGLLITPVVFISLDYWAGIRKAHIRKEKIRSDRMKRTINKISRYYNAILAMLVVDCIQMSGFLFLHLYFGCAPYTFPIFTLCSVLFVAAIEIKSIYEPADSKESAQIKEVTILAKAIAEHKNDPKEIAEAIAMYMNKKEREKRESC